MFKLLITLLMLSSLLFSFTNKELKDKYDLGNQDSGYQLAINLYNKKEYYESSIYFTELMLQGYPKSFKMLGLLFENGYGVDINCQKAVSFYIGGGTAGDCDSYLELERMSLTGSCLNEKKPHIAFKFYKKYLKCSN